MAYTERADAEPDLFLPHRFTWIQRALGGVPVEPTTGDRGPVREAVADIVDAASALEYSRAQLRRVIAIAQDEFNVASRQLPPDRPGGGWGGRNTPAVYYEFYNAVAWTRAVKDRYSERLHAALKHDRDLWTRLQRIRSGADAAFEDARRLAQCSLHKYTPPYAGAGPKVLASGTLVYRVPIIVEADDAPVNLGTMSDDRHVVSIVCGFWTSVRGFVDGLLDIFYPKKGGV